MAELSRKQAVLAILGVATAGHPLMAQDSNAEIKRKAESDPRLNGGPFQHSFKVFEPQPTYLSMDLVDEGNSGWGLAGIEVHYNGESRRISAKEIWQALDPHPPLLKLGPNGSIEYVHD